MWGGEGEDVKEEKNILIHYLIILDFHILNIHIAKTSLKNILDIFYYTVFLSKKYDIVVISFSVSIMK